MDARHDTLARPQGGAADGKVPAMSVRCPDPDLCGRGCRYSRCQGASDGDCFWEHCPQQIEHSGHCPLDLCPFDINDMRASIITPGEAERARDGGRNG